MSRPTGGRAASLAVLLTSALVALVASRSGSPLTPPLPPGSSAPLRGLARLLGIERLGPNAAAALSFMAMLAAVAAFLVALRAAWRGRITVRTALAVGVMLHLLALVVPLLLSRDVYSYAAYGRIVSVHGANPYVVAPSAFPGDPFTPLVSREWLSTPSVYGPVFVALSAAITRLARAPADTVLAFKFLAAVASLGAMFLVAAAARRVRPERAAFAVALLAWNPVVIFHTVGGGRADALLVLAIAAAAFLLLRGREMGATAVLALAALVKVTAGVPLLVALVAAAARRPPGQRLRTLSAHLGLAAGTALVAAAPFFDRRAPTLGLSGLVGQEGWAAPFRLVRRAVGSVLPPGSELLVGAAFGAILVGALVLVMIRLAYRRIGLEPGSVLAAIGWTTLVAVLAAPLLHPWYTVLVLPLAWLMPRSARRVAVLMSGLLAATHFLAEPGAVPAVWQAMLLVVHYVAAPVLLVALVWLLRSAGDLSDAGAGGGEVAGGGEPSDDEQPRAAEGQTQPVGADRPEDHRGDAG